MTGDLVGTLRYMSPEQALGDRLEIDRRTDIYSLGATLYELMTLEPVFPGQDRIQLLEQIARQDPRPPRRFNPATPVDLETIVLKALAKNPRERYATAQELAADLQRYLEDRPIQARRPTLRQRAARWARRHVVLVRAAAVVLVVAAVGLAVSSALIWRSQRQTQEAFVKAERMQQLAESAVNDMTEVAEQWLDNEPQGDPLQRKFLLKALDYFKEFARENCDCPSLGEKTALAYKRAGVIQHKLGQDSEAEANLSEAVRRFQSFVDDFPGVSSHLSDLASSYNARAIVRTNTGNLKRAEDDFGQARDTLVRALKLTPDDPEMQYKLARHRVNLAVLLTGAGRFPEAEQELKQALEMDDHLVARHPGVPLYRFGLATTHNNRGILFWRTERFQDAERAWKEGVRLGRELSTAEPRNRRYRETLVHSHGNLVALHHSAGRLAEAEQVLLETLPLRQKLAEEFPDRISYQEQVASTLSNLGLVQSGRGARDKAEDAYNQAVKLYRELRVRNPKAVAYQRQLASTYNNLANLLRKTGRLQEAQTSYRDAVALQEALPEDCRKEPVYRDDLTSYLNNLGYVSWQRGKPEGAEPLLARAVRLRRELVSDFPAIASYREKLVGTHVNLAWLLKRTGKIAGAEEHFRAAVSHAQKLAEDSPQPERQKSLANRREALARLLWETGRAGEAGAFFQAARQAWRKGLQMEPASPEACHLFARFLADCPDRAIADAAQATKLAQKALDLLSRPSGEFWITLGLARYRAGDWKAAGSALDKADSIMSAEEICLRDLLQAMSRQRLGDNKLAKKYYDGAAAGLEKLWIKEDDLERLRLEAHSVMNGTADGY
jgi:tetratricopeptide (TPR) repeat protein